MIVLTSNDDSTYEGQSRLHRLLPHYGTTLPLTRAITCHFQVQNDTSGAGKTSFESGLLLRRIANSPEHQRKSARRPAGLKSSVKNVNCMVETG